MIKKLVILAILIGAGCVGYLVWSNLRTDERAAVTRQVGKTANQTKQMAKQAADTILSKTRQVIQEHLMDRKPDPPPRNTADKAPLDNPGDFGTDDIPAGKGEKGAF